MSITAVLTAKRTTATAPACIQVRGDDTTSSRTSDPYKDCVFYFKSGESGARATETWGIGAQPDMLKSEHFGGPFWARTYRDFGTFTMSMVAFDGVDFDTDTEVLTLTDPTITFSGANTICFSTSGNFTGAPTDPSTQKITTSASLQSIFSTYYNTGKKLLFKELETWTRSGAINLNSTGPVHIGSFGPTGARFIINDTNASSTFVTGSSCTDHRFVGIEVDKNANDYFLIETANTKLTDALVLDCYSHDGRGLIVCDGAGACIHDSVSRSTELAAVAVYPSANSGQRNDWTWSMMGCDINLADYNHLPADSAGPYETFRACHYKWSTMQHNKIGGGGAFYAAVKMHAPSDNSTHVSLAYAELTSVAYNEIFSSGFGGSLCMELAPQNNGSDERIRKVVIEGNLFHDVSTTNDMYYIQGEDITVRNNVWKLTASSQNNCLRVLRRSSFNSCPGPNRVQAYNNTVYKTNSGSLFQFIQIDSGSTSTAVFNNLGYAPSATSPTMISNSGTSTTSGSNTSFTTNPQFINASGNFDRLSDFKLGASSPFRDTGATLPIFLDATGVYEPQQSGPPQGALEYDNGELPPWGGGSPPAQSNAPRAMHHYRGMLQ